MCLVSVPRPAHSQQLDVRPYETEEDLWEALREGEISYQDYLALLEQYRLGADSTLVPMSDWEVLPGSGAGYLVSPDSQQSITSVPATGTKDQPGTLRWAWRSGVDGVLSSPTRQDGYATGRASGEGWRALVHYRDDNRGARWQRRVVEYNAGPATLQAGNIEPRWGRGLVVGRRSRLIGNTTDDPSPGDFWQPALSRFNGVRITTDQSQVVAGDALVTDVRSAQFRERAAALMFTSGRRFWRTGITGLKGEVERSDSAATRAFEIAGAHLQLGDRDRAVLLEVASTENGATAKAAEGVWQFERGRFHGRAWSYSAEFINPWGGGPGHGDQTTVEIPEVAHSWASRTTGERGLALSTRVEPAGPWGDGRLRAHWDWMTHREYPGEPLRHDWTARLEWRRRRAWIRPFARGNTTEGEPSRHALGVYADWGGTDTRFSIRSEFGRHRVDGDRFVRLGCGGRWRLNDLVRLQPAVRWVDPDLNASADGYWYLYFTEVIFPASWWQLEAALVWQRFEDRGHGDVVEVRVRANVAR